MDLAGEHLVALWACLGTISGFLHQKASAFWGFPSTLVGGPGPSARPHGGPGFFAGSEESAHAAR